jgi:hypothetical protein
MFATIQFKILCPPAPYLKKKTKAHKIKILPVVLCGCESLACRHKGKSYAESADKMLRRIFEPM